MFMTITVLIIGLIIPNLKGKEEILPGPTIDEGVVFTKPPAKDPDVRPPQVETPPQNLLRPSMVFLPPVITEDDKAEIDTTIHTMEDLNNSDNVISNVEIKGNKNGTITPTDELIEAPVDNEIHIVVGQMPEYPGGNEELFKYLNGNIKYPEIAAENGVHGTVYVQFVVFASGEIGKVEVVRGFDQSCEKEALRVIKKMIKWKPGKQNGNPVNVQMSVPVRFVLSNN
jgi:protein TonB